MEEILDKLNALTHKKGFVYSLLLIIRRNQFGDISEYGMMDPHDRLLADELGLLLRYWVIDNKNPFDVPDSLEEMSKMKHEALDLLESLHLSYLKPASFPKQDDLSLAESGRIPNDSFPMSQRLKEAFFYNGDSIYDFEYLDYIQAKYKYDSQWLKTNKGYVSSEVITITRTIKEIITQRNRSLPGISEALRYKLEHPEGTEDDYLINDFFEFLVGDTRGSVLNDYLERNNTVKEICDKLLSLFCIEESEINSLSGHKEFLENFSIDLTTTFVENYDGPGHFNVLASKPLLRVSDTRYFIPVLYWLFMSIYESPFYWMMEDEQYSYQAGSNRGQASEDITYEILNPVFGNNLYRDIVVKGKRKKDKTDIDLLAIVGSVAICFQVKSKKLTEASKQGSVESITSDFKKAVIDAYTQGLLCRDFILNPGSVSFSRREDNTPLIIPSGVDEVFIVCLTSENYPALPLQIRELASLFEGRRVPVAFSVFDLRLIAHYLTTPYEIAYYIRQRIETADYFWATNEISYLGYHLRHKLWRDPTRSFVVITDEYASEIDHNYYPYLAQIKVDNESEDRIASRWRNDSFERLWREIAEFKDPRRTKIVFDLFDLSGALADELISRMEEATKQAKESGERVALTTVFDGPPAKWGLSYVVSPLLFRIPLKEDMSALCSVRKYEYHADKWIVIGKFLNSPRYVDLILVDTNPWAYDNEMERIVRNYNVPEFPKNVEKTRIGRNELCPCGSGKKYKDCHGR